MYLLVLSEHGLRSSCDVCNLLLTKLSDTIIAEMSRTQLYPRHPLQHPPRGYSCKILMTPTLQPPDPRLHSRALQTSLVSWTGSVCFSTTCLHQRGRGWPAILSHILLYCMPQLGVLTITGSCVLTSAAVCVVLLRKQPESLNATTVNYRGMVRCSNNVITPP